VFLAGDGREIQVVCVTERHWRRLCAALGHPDWIEDPVCRDNQARLAHRDLVHSRVAQAISGDTADSWVRRISDEGGLCENVRDIQEAWADDRLAARGLASTQAEGGPGWSARIPTVSLVRNAADPLAPAPALGADTEAVTRELEDR
jgi:crotonobetainyl-CoA:carnitine CoA-transferase CaiB-like acyl-CoA transferase